MGNLGEGFDASGVKPSESFVLLPAGKYPVVVESSETKPYKHGPGERLELKLQVIDGEFKGRKLFDGLNLDHPNNQTVEIAQRQLSALCHATKVMKPPDSSELHDIPIMAEVKVTPAKGEYKAKNEIQTYKAMDGGTPVTATPVADVVAENAKRPW